MAFLPKIGLKGLYALADPFAGALLEKVPYTCIGVRTLGDIIASGKDPLAEYYTPASLTAEQYAADVAAGVCIVTLQASSDSVVYVPHTYITAAPAIGGVAYTQLLMAADLGAVPDTMDLAFLQTRLADVIRETIGIETEIQLVAASPTTLLSYDEDSDLRAARTGLISLTKTDYARALAAEALNVTLQEKVEELSNYIVSLNLPPTP
jgi:hypothetical protein